MRRAVTTSAAAVPRAAPATPSPAPGRGRAQGPRVTVRAGKMSRVLNTTSRVHSRMFRALGVRMSPLHWSMPPAVCRSSTKGRAQA